MTAVVVGGGIAGLVAARRLVRANRDVVLLEAGDALGGRVARVRLAGVELDAGAESFAVRGGTVARLAEALGLGADVVDPEPGGAWVALADRTVPLPAGGVLGIPAVPLASDVLRVLGAAGGARAHLDRLLPVLKVGTYEFLGPLVRRRMGRLVLERLVAPVVESVYGADPDDVRVDDVAPGLNAALTRMGTLAGAVVQLRASAPAGSAVQGLRGGLFRLVDALAAELHRFGADIRTGVPVGGLERADDGWTVVSADGPIAARSVVLAGGGALTADLLQDSLPGLATTPRPEPAVSRTVLLAVDEPALDTRPRGSGVLRASGNTAAGAVALTHVTAKWGWAADLLPPHRHVLRLSYRGGGPIDDEEALADASAMLGTPLPAPVDRADVVWADCAPALAPATRALRSACSPLPDGLEAVGSWVDGTGLASVVSAADRVHG